MSENTPPNVKETLNTEDQIYCMLQAVTDEIERFNNTNDTAGGENTLYYHGVRHLASARDRANDIVDRDPEHISELCGLSDKVCRAYLRMLALGHDMVQEGSETDDPLPVLKRNRGMHEGANEKETAIRIHAIITQHIDINFTNPIANEQVKALFTLNRLVADISATVVTFEDGRITQPYFESCGSTSGRILALADLYGGYASDFSDAFYFAIAEFLESHPGWRRKYAMIKTDQTDQTKQELFVWIKLQKSFLSNLRDNFADLGSQNFFDDQRLRDAVCTCFNWIDETNNPFNRNAIQFETLHNALSSSGYPNNLSSDLKHQCLTGLSYLPQVEREALAILLGLEGFLE